MTTAILIFSLKKKERIKRDETEGGSTTETAAVTETHCVSNAIYDIYWEKTLLYTGTCEIWCRMCDVRETLMPFTYVSWWYHLWSCCCFPFFFFFTSLLHSTDTAETLRMYLIALVLINHCLCSMDGSMLVVHNWNICRNWSGLRLAF